jgi:regulation of enolase protein 1 (concanavalin A-like superfamily)
MDWLNEPPAWRTDGDALVVTAGAKTDFWRLTHYGFVRDNGHLYGRRVAGDFEAEVTVRGEYAAQYDQAGLMVRVDETTWLKCGIELVDGVQQVSAVVTRDYSDWSVVPLAESPQALHLTVRREGSALQVRYALDGGPEALLRLAYLPMGEAVLVGPMCAAPDGDGFTVRFEAFAVRGR